MYLLYCEKKNSVIFLGNDAFGEHTVVVSTEDVLHKKDRNRHHARLSRRLTRMGYTGDWIALGTDYASLADCARMYPNVTDFLAHYLTHRIIPEGESSGDSDNGGKK